MYNHKDLEKEIESEWEKTRMDLKVKKIHEKDKPYYFCDGPPYVTGQIHPGTGWNKIVKDSYIRYKWMTGHNVRNQAGFDTHGLPIEVKVEKEMNIKNKAEIEEIGIEKFVEHCKAFANKYITIMTGQFKSLGVWMDFDDPYITYKDSYIEASWDTIKKAHENGLLEEGNYVVPYCYRCETTMANYELEYGEETDPSVYVKFKVKGKENEYLIIWTTTPWTLVSNMAVMVNPKFEYVKARVGDDIWIVAKERLDIVSEKAEANPIVIETLMGKELEGLEYEHPFQDVINKEYNRKVVLSDRFVTLEDGSGLVHCAPGHGPEDYSVGKQYGIEIFSPVDDHGNYTKEAGKLTGKNVRAVNPEIINILKEHSKLVAEERIRHRYPHCWRCKTPLIFRTTRQWFITISKMKEKMLEQINDTIWYPDFAKERFKQFVSEAPDWCISRQRYWGIPLPIWKCDKCGKIKLVGSRKEFNPEFQNIKELHRPYIDKVTFKCDKCEGTMHRVPDVMDVWFDSGNATWASLRTGEKEIYGNQSDLIIEGQDQIRGWFYSLLGSGMLKYNTSAYKRVIMHGFFVDEKGEKMSKSLGNFVPLEEILDKYGADVFRLWSLSSAVWNELKFNWNELKDAHNDLNVYYNLIVYLKKIVGGNSQDSQNPRMKDIILPELKATEDKWLYSKLNSVLKSYKEYVEDYHMHKAVKVVRNFLVDDVSRFYMKIAKDRMDTDPETVSRLMYKTMKYVTIMLAPLVPHITEWAYKDIFKDIEGLESVHMFSFPLLDDNAIDAELEGAADLARDIFSQLLMLRQEAKIKIRWPLKNAVINLKKKGYLKNLSDFKDVLKGLANLKEISFVEEKSEDELTKVLNSDELQKYDSDKFSLYLNTKISEDLYEEGVFNEIKRRIQFLRKKLGLVETDAITTSLVVPAEYQEILGKWAEKLRTMTNSRGILFEQSDHSQLSKLSDISNTYKIDGRDVKVFIKKL